MATKFAYKARIPRMVIQVIYRMLVEPNINIEKNIRDGAHYRLEDQYLRKGLRCVAAQSICCK